MCRSRILIIIENRYSLQRAIDSGFHTWLVTHERIRTYRALAIVLLMSLYLMIEGHASKGLLSRVKSPCSSRRHGIILLHIIHLR